MRKKLLALLMCATMVLGTSVTAMAAVKDDAKALGTKNAQKFIDEYYPTAKTLVSKTQNGTKGQVEYGYIDNDNDAVLGSYDPVVVYSKDDVYHPATWVYSNAGKLKAYETKAVVTTGNTVAKVIASTSFKIEYDADDKSNVYKLSGTTLTQLTKAQVEGAASGDTKYADKDGNVIVETGTNTSVTAITSAQAADKAAAETAVADKIGDTNQPAYAAMTVYDDNGASSVMIAKEAAGSATKVDGFVTNTNNYVKKDSGKGTLVEAGESFIKTDAAFGKVYSNITKAGETFLADGTTSVEYALNNKVLTKDAVAVKVYSYVQGPAATENVLNLEGGNGLAQGYAKPLYNYTKLQGGTYTFDSDLISRTGFKDAEAVAVFQPSLFTTKFDIETGAQYYEFNKIAEVAVNDVITFDSNPTYVDGQVFIFDKGELTAEPEADKNDGVSDTTATTDNTTSPKTGDVAPIAALAVVMMGAFGAMVVASKKRA